MRTTLLLLPIMTLACGGSQEPPRSTPPPQAHDGIYTVNIGEVRGIEGLSPCGYMTPAPEPGVLDVTVNPVHITVDGTPDEMYDRVEFGWETSDDGVRYAQGIWLAGPFVFSISIADDRDGRAIGYMRLLELDFEGGTVRCGDEADLEGTYRAR